ncbi:MAG: M16 family metallopeptidase, partial [Nitrospira sp.]
LEYIDSHYRPEEIVVAIAGNFDHHQLEKTMARTFGGYRKSSRSIPRKRWPPELLGGAMMKQKSLEQVHLCVGFESVAAGHKDRYAVYALNAVLGGSVSSRLFQEIREKRGLSYSIYSFLSGYSDSGTITVYAGIRAREVERVLDLVHREIRKLARHGIDSHELKRTKDQMKGSLMLSLESSHSRMNKLAKDELIAGTHTTLEDVIAEIDGVTEQQVFQTAQNLFIGDRIALTGLGPLSSRQVEGLSARFS